MEPYKNGCRAFIAAVRLGSYAEAAKELGYSVSSISRMVSEMESSLGVKVLEKGQYGVRLTPQGAELLPQAKRLVSELDRFNSVAREIASGETGAIRIGSISSVATEVLPSLMRAFNGKHPNVTFEVIPGDYQQIKEMLIEGTIDFGTLKAPMGSGFTSLPVLEDELVAVVPNAHALSSREMVAVEDLKRHRFIALERPDLSLSEVDAWMAASGFSIEPSISVWDDNAAMAMVEAGLGLAVLPETVTRRTNFDVCLVPLVPSARRRIDLVWLDEEALSPVAKRFLELVKANGFALPPVEQ